jgi:hypothetical protein
MSNLETHEAEQAAITAACEALVCNHPDCHPSPCDRAQQIMDETAAAADGDGEYPTKRRAARFLLAVAPAYDDFDTATGIQDAITDLFHLCDLAGWDFDDIQHRAHAGYMDERHHLGAATDDALRLAIESN